MNIDLATQPPLGCPRRVGQVIVVSVTHHQHVDVVWRRSGLACVACSPRSKDVRLTDPLERRKGVRLEPKQFPLVLAEALIHECADGGSVAAQRVGGVVFA